MPSGLDNPKLKNATNMMKKAFPLVSYKKPKFSRNVSSTATISYALESSNDARIVAKRLVLQEIKRVAQGAV